MINKKAVLILVSGSFLFYALGLFNIYLFDLSEEILKNANLGVIMFGMILGAFTYFIASKIPLIFNNQREESNE